MCRSTPPQWLLSSLFAHISPPHPQRNLNVPLCINKCAPMTTDSWIFGQSASSPCAQCLLSNCLNGLVKHDVTYSVLRPQMHHSVTTSIIQPMFTFLKSIFDVDHESVTTQNYLDVVLELYTCISGFLLYMTLKWEYLHRFSIFSISVFVISRRSWNILRSVP